MDELVARMIGEHIDLYQNEPHKGQYWDSTPFGGPGVVPCLLLLTRGRKTGNTSTLPLIYGESNGAYVVIASKGGAPAHPAWYLNLEAEAECKVQVGADHYQVRARTTAGSERKTLWKMMAEIYPPYDDYQAATERKIPVVMLERVG